MHTTTKAWGRGTKKSLKKSLNMSLGLLMLSGLSTIHAAENNEFLLGEVLVISSGHDSSGAEGTSIDLDTMRRFNTETVGATLNMAPGVTLSKIGARNEQMVYVRGFDLRQVPVFVDGIPVYVPYDGYVDLGRFNTFDLARVDVSKGFSSLMYGPNTLGGAINLVSRRAAEGFTGEAGGGSSFTDDGGSSGYRSYVNLGYGAQRWYVQASASILDNDSFPLSDDFVPNAGEDGGDRDNSANRDTKFTLKIAYTPNASDEYALSYINQQGEKGNPPYAGSVSSINRRYWDWPYWDKESLYFISSTNFGINTVKTRLYLDQYGNSLYSYDDNTYTTQKRPYAFGSIYDDETWGASIELATQFSDTNLLKTSVQWKDDTHREQDVGLPWSENRDETWSLAMENTRQLSPALTLIAGIGYNGRESIKANRYNTTTKSYDEFPLGDNSGVIAQTGLFWNMNDDSVVHASIAKKNRFATVKDRYSFRMGTAIPNPDLKTESAIHYEIGYGTTLGKSWRWQSNVFYSDITDLMQSVRIAPTACTSAPCSQLQNVGKATSRGAELSIDGSLGLVDLGMSYTYVDRDNRSSNTVRLTDTPLHSLFVHGTMNLRANWQLTASVESASERINSTDGRQRSAGFGVINLNTVYTFNNGISIEGGVNNATDRLYQYSEGFPEVGRTLFVQFNLPFNR